MASSPPAPEPGRLARWCGGLYGWVYLSGLCIELGVLPQLTDALRSGDPSGLAPLYLRWAAGLTVLNALADATIAWQLNRLLRRHTPFFAWAAMGLRGAFAAALAASAAPLWVALGFLASPANPVAALPPTTALLTLRADLFAWALIPFGLSLVLVGLAVRHLPQPQAPRSLGLLLGIAGLGYVLNTLALFFLPDLLPGGRPFLLVPALVGELWLCGWLLRGAPGLGGRG